MDSCGAKSGGGLNFERRRGYMAKFECIITSPTILEIWNDITQLFGNNSSVSKERSEVALSLCQEFAVWHFTSQIYSYYNDYNWRLGREKSTTNYVSFCEKYFPNLMIYISTNPELTLKTKNKDILFKLNNGDIKNAEQLLFSYFGDDNITFLHSWYSKLIIQKTLAQFNSKFAIPMLMMPYKLGKLMGEGKRGTVYEGSYLFTSHSPREYNDVPVAIKIMFLNDIVNLDDLRKAIQELSDNIRLPDHPNLLRAEEMRIIPFLDLSGNKIKFMITMKMELGLENLHDLLKQEKISTEEETHEIIRQIAAGLDFLHKHELVHGDLHSKNVIITKRSPLELKIIDFDTSISSIATTGGSSRNSNRSSPPSAKGVETDHEWFADIIYDDIYKCKNVPDIFWQWYKLIKFPKNDVDYMIEFQKICNYLGVQHSITDITLWQNFPNFGEMIQQLDLVIPNIKSNMHNIGEHYLVHVNRIFQNEKHPLTVRMNCLFVIHINFVMYYRYFKHINDSILKAKEYQNYYSKDSEHDFSDETVLFELDKLKRYRAIANSVYKPSMRLIALGCEVTDESLLSFNIALHKILSCIKHIDEKKLATINIEI